MAAMFTWTELLADYILLNNGHLKTYQSGELILNVVNRNQDEATTTDILSQNGAFTGNFTVYEVNGPDIKSMNDFNKETVKTVEREPIKANGNKITYSFPPHSFTMIKGKMQK
jgi:alpha-N-arabinofuranosidase